MSIQDEITRHLGDNNEAIKTLKQMTRVIVLSVGTAAVSGLVAVVPDLQAIASATLPPWIAPLAVSGIAAVVGAIATIAKANAKNAVTVALLAPSPSQVEQRKDLLNAGPHT